MPVPPVVEPTALGGPGHEVPDARRDLLVAPGTAVRLGPARHRPYDPVAVGPFLDPLRTAVRARPGLPDGVAATAVLARTHGVQGTGIGILGDEPVLRARAGSQRNVRPAVNSSCSSGA